MDHNIVQYLHSAILNSATATINSATSKSARINREAFKYCNINSETQISATLFSATLNGAISRSPASNSKKLIKCSVNSANLKSYNI